MRISGNIFLAKIFFLVSNRNVLNIWVEVMQFKIRDVFLNHPLILFLCNSFSHLGVPPFFQNRSANGQYGGCLVGKVLCLGNK